MNVSSRQKKWITYGLILGLLIFVANQAIQNPEQMTTGKHLGPLAIVDGETRFGSWDTPPDFLNQSSKYVLWDVYWLNAPSASENLVDGFTIHVTSQFTLKEVVVNEAGDAAKGGAGIYLISGSTATLVATSEIHPTQQGWVWTPYSVNYPNGVGLQAGVYFVTLRGDASGGIIGVPLSLQLGAGQIGESAYRFSVPTGAGQFPTSLDMTQKSVGWTENQIVPSLYLTDRQPPVPLPPAPQQAMVIPTVLTAKSCMRGYGGFITDPPLWTTASYRFIRMQVYGSITSTGDLIPLANWNPQGGNEGGATWPVIETFLSDCKRLGGIPNLSLWIHNFEELATTYNSGGSYAAQTSFFTRLKSLMEKYGLTEMIMEPAWEFNHDDYWGVSPAQQRSSTIGPYDYAYGMAALRLARDNVGIKCSLVSHILALHGDKWTDPNRETWKRTVVQPYFDGMKYADIVTVSLYLDASGWQSSWNTNKGPQPTTWQEYLAWIYTNVVGLQKGETGWAPALYVGTTEHNLDSGAVADTDVYAYDFNKFEMSGCSLFGWWIDFSSPSVRTFVNQQAQAMQARYPLGSQNPAENPVTTNNPTQPPYTSGSSQAEETAPPGSSLWPNLPFDSRTIAAAVLIAVVVGLVAFSILKKKKMG